MLDINKVRENFKKYLSQYDNQEDLSFKLKLIHTVKVSENAKTLATNMGLSQEDIDLAELIGYLHDLGRFEELKQFKGFNSAGNDHAMYASKILFDDNQIRDFIEDNSYDNIIKKAIENHNKFVIEDGLNDRELLHAKLIRDADKLDNFRVCMEESIETRFPGKFSTIEEFNESLISDKVYDSILKNECVDIHDRVYPLDYWLCVLAFIFDLTFKETFEVVKNKDYMNLLIDKFDYKNEETKNKIEIIRKELNNYIDKKIEN